MLNDEEVHTIPQSSPQQQPNPAMSIIDMLEFIQDEAIRSQPNTPDRQLCNQYVNVPDSSDNRFKNADRKEIEGSLTRGMFVVVPREKYRWIPQSLSPISFIP